MALALVLDLVVHRKFVEALVGEHIGVVVHIVAVERIVAVVECSMVVELAFVDSIEPVGHIGAVVERIEAGIGLVVDIEVGIGCCVDSMMI